MMEVDMRPLIPAGGQPQKVADDGYEHSYESSTPQLASLWVGHPIKLTSPRVVARCDQLYFLCLYVVT